MKSAHIRDPVRRKEQPGEKGPLKFSGGSRVFVMFSLQLAKPSALTIRWLWSIHLVIY